jgi:hypothetical protein
MAGVTDCEAQKGARLGVGGRCAPGRGGRHYAQAHIFDPGASVSDDLPGRRRAEAVISQVRRTIADECQRRADTYERENKGDAQERACATTSLVRKITKKIGHRSGGGGCPEGSALWCVGYAES